MRFLLLTAAFATACQSLGPPRPEAALPPPDPDLPATLYLQHARTAERNGDLDVALEQARYALALDPENPALYVRVGVYFAAVGQWDQAEAAYRAALDRRADDRDARLALGWLRLHQGRSAVALDEINLSANRFEETHLKGALLVAAGDASAGRALLRKAKALADRDPRAVPDIAIADIDCRLAARDDDAVCPLGPLAPPSTAATAAPEP